MTQHKTSKRLYVLFSDFLDRHRTPPKRAVTQWICHLRYQDDWNTFVTYTARQVCQCLWNLPDVDIGEEAYNTDEW